MDIEYLKKMAIYAVTALVSVLVIVYVVIQLVSSFGSRIATEPAALVTERELSTLDACIIRNEKVLYAPFEGTAHYLFNNGTKVRVSTVVANVYSGAGDTANEIIKLDKQIAVLRNSSITEDMVISDTATLDSRIASSYTGVCDYVKSGKLQYAILDRNEILSMLNRRQIMVKTVENYDERIGYLTAWRDSLKKSYSGSVYESVADVSGYFYDTIDGYEDIFSAYDVNTMTIDDYYSLLKATPREDAERSDEGYAIGKLARSYAWYIACVVPYSETYNYSVGKTYTVIYPYNGDIEVQATVHRVITEPSRDVAVIILKNGYVRSSFSYLRYQTVQIVSKSHTGYKVPLSAVKIVDGVQGVYVLNGSIVSFREIKPVYQNNGYLICEVRDVTDVNQQKRLNAYEEIIVDDGDYYDGQILS